MVRAKTGRPLDIPMSSGLNVVAQDFETRAPMVPPGAISYIYTGEIRQTTITNVFNYTLANETILLIDASGMDVVVTLPATSGKANKIYYVKKTDSSGHTVTIKGDSSSETIDGEESITISLQYQYIMIVCDGLDWHILGGEYVKMDEILRQILEEIKEINETVRDTKQEVEAINN